MRNLKILLVILLMISCSEKGQKITLYTNNINGLTEKAKVQINGFEVGSVKKFTLKKNLVLVDIFVREDFDIPSDSKFIESIGLLNNSNIDINLGKLNSFIKSGDTVELLSQKTLSFKKVDTISKIISGAIKDIVNVIEKDSINGIKK